MNQGDGVCGSQTMGTGPIFGMDHKPRPQVHKMDHKPRPLGSHFRGGMKNEKKDPESSSCLMYYDHALRLRLEAKEN